ncbi:MAG: hypothetical protein AAB352_01055 [Patescibacteria group bacterium]
MMREGEQFLHQKDSELHISDIVEHEQERKKIAGEKTSQKPAEKIADWLSVIEKTHTGHREDPRVIEKMKEYYYREHVIKSENIPESYWDLQRRIIINEGRGDDFEKDEQGKIIITEETRRQATEVLISDQKQSLDKWFDYLTSPDADVYPIWAKYWAFNSVVKMGKIEKKEDEQGNETARFQKRTEDTVAAFPPLNPRAFAMAVGVIIEKAEENAKLKKDRKTPENKSVKLNEKSFQKLISTENFSKIYAQFLVEMPEYSSEGLKNINGKWVKYPQNSDPKPLVDSLEGHPLEWCTANIDTARAQLQGGDFYVYYSYGKDDEPENPTIPRLAIRMEGDKISNDVRGIATDQNLDPYIAPVLEKKLKDFGKEGESFKKKSADMKQLTELGLKIENRQKLTQQEIKFIYELNSQIEGFGYQKDPRIKELREQRNLEEDILAIFECKKEQIAQKPSEITKDTKVYIGKLEPGIFELIQIYNIEHIYTSFPEGRIKKEKIGIGEKSAEILEQELRKKEINISETARYMLKSKDFTTQKNTENINLVKLKVRDLGFNEAVTVDQIYKKAEELGLKLCPSEVGPNLRLKYIDQPMGEWIFIGMKQIADRDGNPHVFVLGRYEGGLWLSYSWARPDDRWNPGRELVFYLCKF